MSAPLSGGQRQNHRHRPASDLLEPKGRVLLGTKRPPAQPFGRAARSATLCGEAGAYGLAVLVIRHGQSNHFLVLEIPTDRGCCSGWAATLQFRPSGNGDRRTGGSTPWVGRQRKLSTGQRMTATCTDPTPNPPPAPAQGLSERLGQRIRFVARWRSWAGRADRRFFATQSDVFLTSRNSTTSWLPIDGDRGFIAPGPWSLSADRGNRPVGFAPLRASPLC